MSCYLSRLRVAAVAATCHGAGCPPSRPHPRRSRHELRLCHPAPAPSRSSPAHTPRLHVHQVIVVWVDALQAVGIGILADVAQAPKQRLGTVPGAAPLQPPWAAHSQRVRPLHAHIRRSLPQDLGSLAWRAVPCPPSRSPSPSMLRAGGGQEPELGSKKLNRTHLQADRLQLLQRPESSHKAFCFALREVASGPASYEAQHVLNVVRVTLAVRGCIRHTAGLQVRGDQCKVAAAATENTPSSSRTTTFLVELLL